jgi:ketosteroid isomerase-like protein
VVAIDRASVRAWVDAYERAWRAPGTDALATLFTEDATYSMEPYGEPARGLTAISALWERERVGADETFTMTSEVVAVEGDTAVVRLEVEYFDQPRQYRDLWVLRFADDGRCVAFEEWPYSPGRFGATT